MLADITLAFIGHNEFDLMRRTIPHNMEVLAGRCQVPVDTMLILDNADRNVDALSFVSEAHQWGINEVRLRSRQRIVAPGDGANNPHVHLISDRTKYLVSIEADVAVFPRQGCDLLGEIVDLFKRVPQVPVITKVSDHDCWAWALEDVGKPFGLGVRNVNRLSSHFLAYDTERLRRWIPADFDWSVLFDDGKNWYNYEDVLSLVLAQPAGPGIAFAESLRAQVFHCDEKVVAGSPFYKRDRQQRLDIFECHKNTWLASA
jgi:hypothetical protein